MGNGRREKGKRWAPHHIISSFPCHFPGPAGKHPATTLAYFWNSARGLSLSIHTRRCDQAQARGAAQGCAAILMSGVAGQEKEGMCPGEVFFYQVL